jgi:hypothetical protein
VEKKGRGELPFLQAISPSAGKAGFRKYENFWLELTFRFLVEIFHIANSLIFINSNIYFEISLLAAYKINKLKLTQVKMLWTEFKSDKTGSVLQQPICYGA